MYFATKYLKSMKKHSRLYKSQCSNQMRKNLKNIPTAMKIGIRNRRPMMGLIQGLISLMKVIGRIMKMTVSKNHPVKRRKHYVFMFLSWKQSFMTNLNLIFTKRKREHMIYGWTIRLKITWKVRQSVSLREDLIVL